MERRQTLGSWRAESYELRIAIKGAAGVLGLAAPAGGGLALAVKGDTRFTRTQSKATKDANGGRLEAATGDVWLLRLGVEGSRRFALGAEDAGATLTPRFEVGARLDGGDAGTSRALRAVSRPGPAQPGSTSNATTLRESRLNSTATR